jgi:F-type H+-transporting ATPase subunit b
MIFVTAARAAEDAKEAGKAVGMPQLDFSTYPSQIFWLVVAMVALFYILSRVALPRISSVLEARSDAIASDLDQAAEFKRQAEEAEAAYEEALSEARSKAQNIAAEARAEIQKEVEAETARAEAQIAEKAAESEARIAEIRDSALADVEAVAAETAVALVAAVAPGAADGPTVRAAVAARLQG